MFRPLLAVFITGKLIACDTILPLLLEVHDRAPKTRIRVYCFDDDTYDCIKINRVLWEAIHSIGDLRRLGGGQKTLTGRIGRLFATAIEMLKLTATALLGRATFIHFRTLENWPFRILFIANRRRTFLVERNCWGYSPIVQAVDNLYEQRKTPVRAATAASALVCFSRDWPELEKSSAGKDVFVLPPTRASEKWLDYVSRDADAMISAELRNNGFPPDSRYFVIVLGYFGEFKFIDGGERMSGLLRDCLRVLAEQAPDIPVLLKPHAITQLDVLNRVMREANHPRAFVSYLHPAVLALRALAVLCNYYSSALGDARLVGAPTIEFTAYNADCLKVTGGGSMRPEHVDVFIQDDKAELRRVIDEIVKGTLRYEVLRFERGDTDRFLDRLAPIACGS